MINDNNDNNSNNNSNFDDKYCYLYMNYEYHVADYHHGQPPRPAVPTPA